MKLTYQKASKTYCFNYSETQLKSRGAEHLSNLIIVNETWNVIIKSELDVFGSNI